jgi:hypothetical protein
MARRTLGVNIPLEQAADPLASSQVVEILTKRGSALRKP